MCPARRSRTSRRQALEASGLRDASLRFYWTGGRDGARTATALATVTPIPDDLEQLRARGIRVVSLELGVDHAARARSPWLLGGVKSTSYAVHVAALAEARRRGADDAAAARVGRDRARGRHQQRLVGDGRPDPDTRVWVWASWPG